MGADGDPEAQEATRAGRRGLFLVAPALLWTVAFFVVPLCVMAAWSLFTRSGTTLDTAPTLINYFRFFSEGALVSALWNSLRISALVTIISILLGYPIAYVIAFRVPERWQRLALMLAVLPFWTSYVVRSYAWLLVLAPNGVVNKTLLALGLVGAPVRIGYSDFATVLGFSHFFAMLVALVVFAGLKRIDPRLRLAAGDLGAGPVATFLRVTLPLSFPAVATSAFLTFVLTVGDYITPQILGGGKSLVLPQAILLQVGRGGDIPMASAMALVLMSIVVIAYLPVAHFLRPER